MLKKYLKSGSAALAILLALSLAACGGQGSSSTAGSGDTASLDAVADSAPATEESSVGTGESSGSTSPPGAIAAALAADWVVWPETLAVNVVAANNTYTSQNQALTWPNVAGATIYSVRADCSGFLSRSLKAATPSTDSDFLAWFGTKWPSAAIYHDTIAAQNKFVRINDPSKIQRGDIIAVKYLDGSATGATGHVMIATGPATQILPATKPIIAGTTQWQVMIIDSSSGPHGTQDTRFGTGPGGTNQNGAGKGALRLYADANNVIAGYTWSTLSGSGFYSSTVPATDRRDPVIGRLDPNAF